MWQVGWSGSTSHAHPLGNGSNRGVSTPYLWSEVAVIIVHGGVVITFLVPCDRTPDRNDLKEEGFIVWVHSFGVTAHHGEEGTVSKVALSIVEGPRGGHFSHLSGSGDRKSEWKQSRDITSQTVPCDICPPARPLVSKVTQLGTIWTDT